MEFTETPIPGAYIIEMQPLSDDRGYFARTFCKEEYEKHGLVNDFVQCSTSFNKKRGTVRGMHYQEEPFSETKLVRCTRGAIYDVIVDIRPASPEFKKWFAVELTQDNFKMLYIPNGLAHGFITLDANTEVFYQISEMFTARHARGIRWNDQAINIKWPSISDKIISDKDQSFEDFTL